MYRKLLIFNKPTLHPFVATLITSIQNWHSWRNRSKPIVFTPLQDVAQINAVGYDSDIDRQIDIQPQALSHVQNTQEESAPVTGNSAEDSILPQDSDRSEPQYKANQSPAQYPSHQNAETISEQHQEGRRCKLEDMPEFEEEDLEDGQFADADLIRSAQYYTGK